MTTLPPPVRAYLDAYNAMDVEGMLGLLTEDVHFANLSGGETGVETRGKAAFAELARAGAGAFTERTQVPGAVIVVGERVMYEVRFTAVPAVDLPNGWRRGERVTLDGTSYVALRGGLIRRIVDAS